MYQRHNELWYQIFSSSEFYAHGYSDTDQADSIDDMRSTACYCFRFGSRVFSWC